MDSFLLYVFEHLKLEAVGKEPVLEVVLFPLWSLGLEFSIFLVKLHVLRPVACYYSKMLGEVQSQIYLLP